MTAFLRLMEDKHKVVSPCRGILEGVHHLSHWSPHSVPKNKQKRSRCIIKKVKEMVNVVGKMCNEESLKR